MIIPDNLSKVGISPDAYLSLSPDEQSVVEDALRSVLSGDTSIISDLYYKDYDEVPVSFTQFISDDNYLGKSTRQGTFLYPFWISEVSKIFTMTDTINEVALTGCLSGDTLISVYDPLADSYHPVRMDSLSNNLPANTYVLSYNLSSGTYEPNLCTKAYCTGVKSVYRIEFIDGSVIKATSNHKFLTIDNTYKSIDDRLYIGDLIVSNSHPDGLMIYSVSYYGEIPVYDLTISPNHNFIIHSNGIVAHNSIGIGKTTVAALMMTYHLYRTMCMKDPQSFFNLSPGSQIVYAFLNNTLGSSYGVAYSAFQSFIQESPWFLKHGKLVGRDNIEYRPEKGFDFVVGSRPQHTLGRHVICLSGDTQVLTTEGAFNIGDLEGRSKYFITYNVNTGYYSKTTNKCKVVRTAEVNDIYVITLSDYTEIKATLDHKFLDSKGRYVSVRDMMPTKTLLSPSQHRVMSINKIHYDTPVPVYDVIDSKPYHNFIIQTYNGFLISHNCAVMDEVSFSQGQDLANYSKSKIMSVYENIKRRMESRFLVQGRNYGLMLLLSSKSTESSFLESYINDQVKKGYPIYVVDQPLWKVKPAAYSGKIFHVAVGNKYKPSLVEPNNLSPDDINRWIEAAKDSGLNVIEVPIEHRQAFDQNVDKALQDIAAISTTVTTKVFNMQRVMECVSDTLVNPFSMDVLTIGLNDDLRYSDYFNKSLLPLSVRSAPVFIHIDTSLRGDKTGISGVAITGTKDVVTNDGNSSVELMFTHVFSVAIQAPSDSEISFEKTRQFIYYLKDEVGMNIKVVSFDGYNSADLNQILTSRGFTTKYTSMDRSPDGYNSLRSAINDHRITLLRNCDLLYNELSELERDNQTGRYDHNPGGSKDCSDSLGGALLNALQYKDEFLFFNPDDFDYEDINDDYNLQESLRSAMIKELMSVGSMSANKIGSLFHHPTDNSPEGDDINDSEYNDHSLGADDNILLL